MAVPVTNVRPAQSTNKPLPENAGVLLVVDDEPLNLDMLSRRLTRTGFTVHVASSGSEALRIIRDITVDLVLLDQMMPEMSGTEVLKALRADAATQMLPVIMVTAVASSDKISEALEDGASDYITKPVDYKVALARIRTQLTRKRAETALVKSEERYALASKASRNGLWDWDLQTGRIFFSDRWKEMLGCDQGFENTKGAWFSRMIASDRQAVEQAIEEYLAGGADVLKCDYRMRHMDGTARWMSCHAIALRDSVGVPVRLTGSQSDITEEKTRDALTGLPNRLRLITELEWALENRGETFASGETAQPKFAVLFLDLNHFKSINDTLGHLIGDKLLILIAARLEMAATRWSLQDDDSRAPLLARMGGDEFAVMLQGVVNETTVMDFAREVRDRMLEVFVLEGIPVHCAFSIGAAIANRNHLSPEDILREADIAMYTTKVESLGNIVLFNPRMRDVATQQFELENEIRSAAANNQLRLVYQPKVDLETGLTYGLEALVRWEHPTRGLLQPGMFIAIAERTGTIVDIGKWVLREACKQVLRWHEEFAGTTPLTLSVNLSPREFRQKDLVESIRMTLEETAFPPACLHFELTETALFEDFTTARRTLDALKQLGVGLDLDDFGTGYSSLKYLRELPFDSLKIDRYFVSSLDPKQRSSSELVGAILSMADVLGLDVIAEGIETEAHRSTLSLLGCRFGQGYLFAKPLDPQSFRTLLVAEQDPKTPALPADSQTPGAKNVSPIQLPALMESA